MVGLVIVLLQSLFMSPVSNQVSAGVNIIVNCGIRSMYCNAGIPARFLAGIPIMGPIWFLWGLFFSLVIYLFISSHWKGLQQCVVILFITTFAVYSAKLINLPLSFQSGCFGVLYIAFGQ